MVFLLNEAIPPMRPDLEIMETVHEGQPVLVLSDPLGLREASYAVSPAVVMIASLFDGKRKVEEVAAELKKHNVDISMDEVQKVADQLKKLSLLETPETQKSRHTALEEFKHGTTRRIHLKSRGLPESALDFGVFLGKFYKDPQGPGSEYSGKTQGQAPLGLVSPHIDFFRGGPHYAWAYNELLKREAPDLIVGVGVAHVSPKSPWVMTQKSYLTPYGPVEVDESLYKEISGALWYDPSDEEWVHLKEHSLEFQALWIKHLWMKNTPKWVPILCSAFENFCGTNSPSSVPTIEEAVQKIGKILAERTKKGQRVMVLAGIDLAHVGKRFGDDMDITPEIEKKIEAHDRSSLDQALKLDAEGFFKAGVGENEWRKVCGLSALYTSLRWIKALSDGKNVNGKLLSYGQAPDPAGGVVSFTSAIFE